MDFKKMMQRAVNAEAKVGLRSSTIIRNLDIYYFGGHRPSNNTTMKVKTQGITSKESKPKEYRPNEAKLAECKNPALPRSESTKFGKTSRTDKKKEYLEKKKKKRVQKTNTPATRDNAKVVEIGEKKKQDNWGNGRCYNCKKKGHFSRNYLELPKN